MFQSLEVLLERGLPACLFARRKLECELYVELLTKLDAKTTSVLAPLERAGWQPALQSNEWQ